MQIQDMQTFRLQALPARTGGASNEIQLVHLTQGACLLDNGAASSEGLYFIRSAASGQGVFSRDARGHAFTFTHDFIHYIPLVYELCLLGAAGKPVLRVENSQRGDTYELLNLIRAEWESDRPYRLDMIRDYLKILLRQIARCLPAPKTGYSADRKTGLVRQFLSLLDQQFILLKKVTDYAANLHVTANHLNTTLKELTGVTASEHIRRRILSEARMLATHKENYSMKEIAYHLGFEDKSHFSKYFKNASGKNFTNYKKELSMEA
ncbi:AraC family transcriptional regulator [Chitinophaga sp.]|uniref:helix-turn-helix domain-containing protein n=1 Tax=Chitinophaga sp. TaxID=1869181 RepID=UPI00263097AD|nr:helix-turn-helix transcriptional regulator [uncultured Chitinophaga sp.]